MDKCDGKCITHISEEGLLPREYCPGCGLSLTPGEKCFSCESETEENCKIIDEILTSGVIADPVTGEGDCRINEPVLNFDPPEPIVEPKWYIMDWDKVSDELPGKAVHLMCEFLKLIDVRITESVVEQRCSVMLKKYLKESEDSNKW